MLPEPLNSTIDANYKNPLFFFRFYFDASHPKALSSLSSRYSMQCPTFERPFKKSNYFSLFFPPKLAVEAPLPTQKEIPSILSSLSIFHFHPDRDTARRMFLTDVRRGMLRLYLSLPAKFHS